jgi:two-component system cell cycle response regulator
VVAVAGTAVLAVRAHRRAAELERAGVDFRRAVARLGEAIGASEDREAFVPIVLEAAMAAVRADVGILWLDRGPSIDPRLVVGGEAARVTSHDGLVRSVADGGPPVRWPGGPAPSEGEPAAASAIAVPLRARGRLYAVLALYRRAGAFSARDLEDVNGLAVQASTAIDATYDHEDARRLSLTDGLTGLWNRRQFELRAAQELERASRFGERFAVVLVDLDGFKAINDVHGHLTGDAVLVETAKRMVTHTREVDLVARYGGEEFVLLLPQTDPPGALRVAEKVREELAAVPVDVDGGALPVTLSAGVACHPDDGATLDLLLAAADEALYAAKRAGKNRVHQAHRPDGAALA